MKLKILNEIFPQAFSRLGLSDSLDANCRNLNEDCGYPSDISLEQYQEMFDRWGVANRACSVYSEETWATTPKVSETNGFKKTGFDQKWEDFAKKYFPFSILNQADIVSQIGHYGILYFHFIDGGDTEEPITEGRKYEIAYMLPLSEMYAKIAEIDNDENSPRRGLPEIYEITFPPPEQGTVLSGGVTEKQTFRVHYSRVLHLAENLLCSEVFAPPRLQNIFNYLLDLRKIDGGSAEMYWQGAFPGLSFETLPDLSAEEEPDDDSIRQQMSRYRNTQQRFIATTGMKVNSLAPQVVDPTPHCMNLLTQIAATLGVPLRIFLGSEAGHLASGQDSATWNRRLAKRQNLYVTPRIIVPFINKLISFGVLPQPKDIVIVWDDLNALSDKDSADVSMKLTQALLQYVTSGAEEIMDLFVFYTEILKMDPERAQAAIDRLEESKKKTKPVWNKAAIDKKDQNAGQNRNTDPGSKKPGSNPAGNKKAK